MRQGVGELVGHGDHRLPDLRPGDGDDLLAGIHHLARLGVARGDDAIEVGGELGEGQQVLGLAQRGARARQVGLRSLAVALDELELGLRRDVAQREVALARLLGLGVDKLRLGVGDGGLGAAHRQRLHRGIEGGQFLALGHDRADIDEARHHAAEDAKAEIGLVARLDGAGEGTERVGGAHDRHDRQYWPDGGCCLLLVVPTGRQAEQQGERDPNPLVAQSPSPPRSGGEGGAHCAFIAYGPVGLRSFAISTFWPGCSICTPALTTISPVRRPLDTAIWSLV